MNNKDCSCLAATWKNVFKKKGPSYNPILLPYPLKPRETKVFFGAITSVKIHSCCGASPVSMPLRWHTSIFTASGCGGAWRHNSFPMLWRSSLWEEYSKYCERQKRTVRSLNYCPHPAKSPSSEFALVRVSVPGCHPCCDTGTSSQACPHGCSLRRPDRSLSPGF